MQTDPQPDPSPADAVAPAPEPTAPEPTAPEAEAVFIVGVSRSGTTLMRRVLDSHSRIGVAGENHFLGHLLPWEGAWRYLRRAGDLRDDAAVRRLVELIYSDQLSRQSRLRAPSPYWQFLQRWVPRADFEALLLAGERSQRGVFTAMLRAYANRKGKPVMGEKTPAHIGWADTLIEWYPGARIIHMMRDPRAVFVSELRRRTEKAVTIPYRWLIRVPPLMRLFILLETAFAWVAAVSRHRTLSRRYPTAYRLVRFEDLVGDPEATIAGVCDFLGVAMEPALLRQKVVSYGARLGEEGFDAGAAERWRASIGPRSERWLRVLVGKRLGEMGYRA